MLLRNGWNSTLEDTSDCLLSHERFDVHCSKGTYIRTLAEDIAKALDCCAHLVELRRTIVEPFDVFSMVTLEQLQQAKESGGLSDMLLPIDTGLPHWPRIELDSIQRGKFRHGQHFPVTIVSQ